MNKEHTGMERVGYSKEDLTWGWGLEQAQARMLGHGLCLLS